MPLSSDMLNNPIGVVTYVPDAPVTRDTTSIPDNNGTNLGRTLHAQWAFSAQEDVNVICKGTAIACDPIQEKHNKTRQGDETNHDPFVGAYEITYAGPDGQESDPWDLIITKRDEIYHATWLKDDVAHYHGIGFVTDGKLVCGWRPVN